MIMCALARVWACVGISPVCTRSRHSLYVHSPYHHRVLERHAPFPAAAVNALTLAFICTYVPSPPLARYLSPVRERSPGLVLVHDTWICIFRLLIEKSLNRSPKRNHRYKSGKSATMDSSHRDQAIAASLVATLISHTRI